MSIFIKITEMIICILIAGHCWNWSKASCQPIWGCWLKQQCWWNTGCCSSKIVFSFISMLCINLILCRYICYCSWPSYFFVMYFDIHFNRVSLWIKGIHGIYICKWYFHQPLGRLLLSVHSFWDCLAALIGSTFR